MEPLSPLALDAIWDPDSEKDPLERLPRAYPFPAILFGLLVLGAVGFNYFDQRPPIWFYLGLHFQVTLSIGGFVFLLKGRDVLAQAWDRLNYLFLFLLSFFLFLSLYLPSRGLYPLLLECIALLTPVAFLLKSSTAAGIAFYEIKPPRHAERKPSAIAVHGDQIREIMDMFQESVSPKDPRRVKQNYLVQIKHHDGTSFFATIGRMENNRGCLLFPDEFGLWGWQFGGYDNLRMIQVLKHSQGLWPGD